MLETWPRIQFEFCIAVNAHFTVYAFVGQDQFHEDWVNVFDNKAKEIVCEVIWRTVEGVLHPQFIGKLEQFLRTSHHVIDQFLEKVIRFRLGVLELFLLIFVHRNVSKVLQSYHNVDHLLHHRVEILFFSSLDNEFDIV